MKKLLFASTRESAGKTSLLAGIAGAVRKNCGYMKPLGDRLVYADKKNMDYDSILMSRVLDLKTPPEKLSLGFGYGKIKSLCSNEKECSSRIHDMIKLHEARDILFIEGGKDIIYGSSVGMDSVSLAGYAEGIRLIFVTGGSDERIMDDVYFIHEHVHKKKTPVSGLLINKVHDPASFRENCLDAIEGMGIKVMGIIPFRDELTRLTIRNICEKLSAGIIAGGAGLDNVVENILVGAMSTGEVLSHILFNRLNKLIITSGDRSDIIVAALESDTAGIVLSNQMLPPPHITAMAEERKIPILIAKGDTFHVAKQIDDMEPLLTFENRDTMRLLAQLAEENIDFDLLFG